MVRISTIKKSEDDDHVIMRLVEMEGINKQTSVNLSKSFSELIKTNLIEEEQENMNQSEKTLELILAIMPLKLIN